MKITFNPKFSMCLQKYQNGNKLGYPTHNDPFLDDADTYSDRFNELKNRPEANNSLYSGVEYTNTPRPQVKEPETVKSTEDIANALAARLENSPSNESLPRTASPKYMADLEAKRRLRGYYENIPEQHKQYVSPRSLADRDIQELNKIVTGVSTTQGVTHTGTGVYAVDKHGYTSDKIHEQQHLMQPEGYAGHFVDGSYFVDGKNRTPDYWYDGSEINARMKELMFLNKLDPTHTYTAQEVQAFRNNPNFNWPLHINEFTNEAIANFLNSLKNGGKIHINPKNKGKFTASAKRAGMSVQEFARHVLANKDKYSTTQVRRANFAKNAKRFKHKNGGTLNSDFIKTNNPFIDKPNLDNIRELFDNYKKINNGKSNKTF